jgi:hypothetical protein
MLIHITATQSSCSFISPQPSPHAHSYHRSPVLMLIHITAAQFSSSFISPQSSYPSPHVNHRNFYLDNNTNRNSIRVNALLFCDFFFPNMFFINYSYCFVWSSGLFEPSSLGKFSVSICIKQNNMGRAVFVPIKQSPFSCIM